MPNIQHSAQRPCPIGVIGLAVMGENLALNIEEKGYPVAVYNRTTSRVDEFLARNPGKQLHGCRSLPEFVAGLEPPRRILLMVKAGEAVDAMIAQLRPLLARGDILVDGGNSWFLDTERRARELAEDGIAYIGLGVSGGEEGARHGPSLMPGGPREAYEALAPILTRIAAQVPDGPCVAYLGPGGAGHFVKMVHNGIEYGDMQLIAEVYDLLKNIGGLDASRLSELFAAWNGGELQSYLIEITAAIFARVDQETGEPLVERILDTAGQKGTGKWMSQNALDLGAPLPTINAAVEARILSSMKAERTAASRLLADPHRPAPNTQHPTPNTPPTLPDLCRQALYAAKICSYAQGMAMLRMASEEYGYELRLDEIARIWKGGCIIRAALLDRIQRAYARDAGLPNLLVDPDLGPQVVACQAAWRQVIQVAVARGIPCMALGDSLAYFDMYRRDRLPANLIQAQRDYFGAHTYERVDREGTFHTDWL
jgi:6-phosphogluconate dehydrogenase